MCYPYSAHLITSNLFYTLQKWLRLGLIGCASSLISFAGDSSYSVARDPPLALKERNFSRLANDCSRAYSIVLPSRCTTARAHVCHADRHHVNLQRWRNRHVIRRGRWLNFLRKEYGNACLASCQGVEALSRELNAKSPTKLNKTSQLRRRPLIRHTQFRPADLLTGFQVIGYYSGECTRRFSGNAVSLGKCAVSRRAPFRRARLSLPDRSRTEKRRRGGRDSDIRWCARVRARRVGLWWLRGRKRYSLQV